MKDKSWIKNYHHSLRTLFFLSSASFLLKGEKKREGAKKVTLYDLPHEIELLLTLGPYLSVL